MCDTLYTVFTVSFILLQHSWKWFLYYRCQNVNRSCKKGEGSTRRRSKCEPHHLVHCIPPPVHADDDISNERNLSLLKEELEKPKPSPEITKDLMRRTFAYRWDSFVSCCSPPSLHEYLSQYPVLKKAAYVCVYVCHYHI